MQSLFHGKSAGASQSATATIAQQAVTCAALMPHAPILVPDVAGTRGDAAQATRRAMRETASRLLGARPDSLVLISPHSPRKPRAFGFWAGERLHGSFANFSAPHAQVNLPNNPLLAEAVAAAAHARGLDTWTIPDRSLDHGALVPLWFLAEAGWTGPTLILSLSYPEGDKVVGLGEAIAEAARQSQQRIDFIASGDMSHRLTADAPCGFHPRAHLFDETFMQLIRDGDYPALRSIDLELRNAAAEDAVDSTLVAAAAVNWNTTGHEVLNYEGPFGVGYGVAILFAEATSAQKQAGFILPSVARQSVTAALCGGDGHPPLATGDYLCTERAVFVTLHGRDGQLRGCVGTITPVCRNVVEETWRNARLAALQDGRFPPVTAKELPSLRFNVSVLHSMETIASTNDLDPARYGVVVAADDERRGLLLPDIPDITTVEQQLSLARRKGQIGPHEPVVVKRFQVDYFEEQAG